MKEEQSRTALLIGEAGLNALASARVAVVGLGGVGGHCAEALARAGVGSLLLIDADRVERSNLNRQLIATKHTLGQPKTEAARERLAQVSDCELETRACFLLSENVGEALAPPLSFIVDAVDTVAAKVAMAAYAEDMEIPIISCMGAGNRLDPMAFVIMDIYKTEGCPLARAVRRGCRDRNVRALPVLISREPAITPEGAAQGSRVPGSISFTPAAAGLALAGYVVRKLIEGVR